MAKSMARISFDHDLSVSTLRRITKAALALAAWVVAPMLDNAGRGSHRLIEMARIGFPIAHAAIAGGGSTSLAEVHGFGACIVTVAADGDPGCRPLRPDTAVSASRWVTREGSRRSGTSLARRLAMPRRRSIPAKSMTPPSEEIRPPSKAALPGANGWNFEGRSGNDHGGGCGGVFEGTGSALATKSYSISNSYATSAYSTGLPNE